MDITLAILAGILITAGIIGSIIQITPGPWLSYAGLLVLNATAFADFTPVFLIITGSAALTASLSDNLLTALGAKYFGGSKRAVIGAILGIIAGIFIFPPLGMIVLSFLGAMAGELTTGKEFKTALKASAGTMLGFLLGVMIKITVSCVFAFYYVKEIIK